MVKVFEENKNYVFDFKSYEQIQKAYSFVEISNKIKELDGRRVTVISSTNGRVPGDIMNVRPEFCKEV